MVEFNSLFNRRVRFNGYFEIDRKIRSVIRGVR